MSDLMGGPTVIFSGMIASTPHQGGATWAVLQYLLGLRRLGWDPFFVEPVSLSAPGSEAGVAYCEGVMRRFDLSDRWSLVEPGRRETAGASRDTLRRVASRAELLINVAGMLADPDVLEAVPTRVYLDLDPVFVQLWHSSGIDMRLDAHTHFVTIADAIGDPACPIPTCGRSWIPTLPPVVLEEWPLAEGPGSDAFTTVAHWRSYGSVDHGGVLYGQKAHSWRPLLTLPVRTGARFGPALAIDTEEPDLRALEANGWHLVDPARVAGTPDDYQRFLQRSRAELGVAKSGYVLANSGWFSDRSACYLASGRPVIAQDTGFGRRLPVGCGLLSFADEADVVRGVEALAQDYQRHRIGARSIAEEHLDSDRVLGNLLAHLSA